MDCVSRQLPNYRPEPAGCKCRSKASEPRPELQQRRIMFRGSVVAGAAARHEGTTLPRVAWRRARCFQYRPPAPRKRHPTAWPLVISAPRAPRTPRRRGWSAPRRPARQKATAAVAAPCRRPGANSMYRKRAAAPRPASRGPVQGVEGRAASPTSPAPGPATAKIPAPSCGPLRIRCFGTGTRARRCRELRTGPRWHGRPLDVPRGALGRPRQGVAGVFGAC